MEQRNNVMNGFDNVIRALDNERLSHDTNQDVINKLKGLKNQVGQLFNSVRSEKDALKNIRKKQDEQELSYKSKYEKIKEAYQEKIIQLQVRKCREEQVSAMAQKVMIADKKLNDCYAVIRRHLGQEAENKVRFHVENL